MQIKYPLGIDISAWEGDFEMKYVHPRPALLIMRATVGDYYTDRIFAQQWRDAIALGIRRGAYHFLIPGYGIINQAIAFVRAIRDAGGVSKTHMDSLWLDFERTGFTAREIKQWLDYVENELGIRPGIYTRKDIWQSISTNGIHPHYTSAYNFWIAGYPYNPDAFSSMPSSYLPPGVDMNHVALWQYSDRGVIAGIPFQADLNWIAPWYAAVLGVANQVPVALQPQYRGRVVHVQGVRLRNAPTTNSMVLEVLLPQTAIEGDLIIEKGVGERWMRTISPRLGFIALEIGSSVLCEVAPIASPAPQPQPTPTPIPTQTYFARLVHDDRNPDWNYKPRNVGLNIAPETVTMNEIPQDGKGRAVPVLQHWRAFLEKLNAPNSYKWLMTEDTAWINAPYAEGEDPKCETISFGGNIVQIDAVSGNYVRIRGWQYDMPPTVSPSTMNYNNFPWLVHKITAISTTGKLYNPAANFDIYMIPLKRTELWIHKNKIEPFPQLPMTVTILTTLNIRDFPNTLSAILGQYRYGDKVAITEYAPRGSSVWGKTDRGWIALLYYTKGNPPRFFTSWRMNTQPPIP